MGENKESITDVIEGLALVTDAVQTLFPDGKIICVYELGSSEFKKVQGNFRKIDSNHNRFSIDISGTEHVFINQDVPQQVEKPVETPKKKTVRQKLLSLFKSGGSSIK